MMVVRSYLIWGKLGSDLCCQSRFNYTAASSYGCHCNPSLMIEKSNVLIYAPTPPQPPGGVGSIVAMLYHSFRQRIDVCFISPMPKSKRFISSIFRPFLNILSLIQSVGRLKKGGRILFFSSAGSSFFEKVLWALLVILLGRKPVVVMVAGDFPEFWDECNPIFRKLSSWVICSPQFVLGAQSERWRDYYQLMFPSSRIKTVGATVAPEFFEHIRQFDSSFQNSTILYVGWIIPEKGIHDLLDAMVILQATHPQAKLRLVGPLFGKEDYWNSVVADRGLSTQVEFVGSLIDRRSLIREFDAASIFVFPSHFEGFPVALLEALTMGLACVGTSVGGIPDILDYGRAGIVVAPKAPMELANALKSLLDDHGLVEMLSRQAAIRARSVYSHFECIESYKNLLGLK